MRLRGVGGDTSSAVPDFVTTFPASETPIAQSSIWLNGGTDGTHWQDVDTTGGSPGKAFGHGFAGESFEGGEFDDPICQLKASFRAFNPNQFVQGIVHRAPGYSPTSSHEIELLTRFAIGGGLARGYEVLWAHDGGMAIVRWNGPKADSSNSNHGFDELASTTLAAAVDGDVLRVEISGSTITVQVNGSTVLTTTDTTWTDGQPGMGFWPRTGGTVVKANYGWRSFKAGNL